MAILPFLKQNTRYFLAAAVIVLMFLISRSFPAEVITSESCNGGSCKAVLDNPTLTKEKPSYYVNDILKTDTTAYYRLTFQGRSNDDTFVTVKVSNPYDEDRELETITLKKSQKNSPREVLFSADSRHTDLIFEKTSSNDGAEVSISSVQVSKLNISSEKEFAGLTPTVRGEIDTDQEDQKQADSSYFFTQLKDPGMILGQIFKPQSDYISGVTLDIDIVKQDKGGGKKYKLELREADFSGRVPEISSNILSSVSFSVEGLEKYRQSDGKFKFPLFSRLDHEKHYFIGINNNADVNKFNYLRLKGTRGDAAKYFDETAAVKNKGETYLVAGNLYFITYGFNFSRFKGEKVLGGEIIEDIGKGRGMFNHQPNGSVYDLADLEQSSADVGYNNDKNMLAGEADYPDSIMMYKFNPVFPVKEIRLVGKQGDPDWDRTSASYSYDKKSWKEIPSQENELQQFDYSWNDISPTGEIYIKIEPKSPGDKKSYGLSNFKVEAQLIMK